MSLNFNPSCQTDRIVENLTYGLPVIRISIVTSNPMDTDINIIALNYGHCLEEFELKIDHAGIMSATASINKSIVRLAQLCHQLSLLRIFFALKKSTVDFILNNLPKVAVNYDTVLYQEQPEYPKMKCTFKSV
ncbi:hypothetical protein ACOME3_008877 [Neoechinorhynchus agilis]